MGSTLSSAGIFTEVLNVSHAQQPFALPTRKFVCDQGTRTGVNPQTEAAPSGQRSISFSAQNSAMQPGDVHVRS
jgi:hypothetical protein